VPILITILIMLCISLYHIGNGGNKLFVFVFVFVLLFTFLADYQGKRA
jgi:hypothetical protein